MSRINKRAKRGSGGILLYIHNRIMENVEILNDRESDEYGLNFRVKI